MSIIDTFHLPADVAEGPSIPKEDSDEGLSLDQFPFAERLRQALIKQGAVISFESGPKKHGEAYVGAGNIVGNWKQFNVRKDLPEELAAAIIAACGKSVTFGELWIPPSRGIQYLAWTRADNVFVRHIIVYRIVFDDFGQRWDVLVRPT